jgi:hypothetical protein
MTEFKSNQILINIFFFASHAIYQMKDSHFDHFMELMWALEYFIAAAPRPAKGN